MRLNNKLKEKTAVCVARTTEIAHFHNLAACTNETLTGAESRVLALVVLAKTNKEIAGALAARGESPYAGVKES